MYILFVVEDANLKGGTELLTFNLIDGFNKRGMDCSILSLTPYLGENKFVMSLTETEWKKWNSKRNCLLDALTFKIYSDGILKKILVNKISKHKPSVVVNQTYDIVTALPSNIFVAQVLNWSVRGYEASLLKMIGQKGLPGRWLSKIVFYGLRQRRHSALSKVDKVVALSRAAITEIKELNYRVKDTQLVVVPDPLVFTTDSNVISTLKNKNVIFVGRLSHEKGVMRLLRIWEQVCQRLHDYSLSIYGEGSAKNEMEKYIATHRVGRVLFKGFTPNLVDIYTNADLLLMTSETEGFGMVLTEAMYFGVPCIAFDCPVSPKEIIADAGITIPCFNEDIYAQKVVETLSDDKALQQLQQKSICRARDFYMDAIIEKWSGLKTKNL